MFGNHCTRCIHLFRKDFFPETKGSPDSMLQVEYVLHTTRLRESRLPSLHNELSFVLLPTTKSAVGSLEELFCRRLDLFTLDLLVPSRASLESDSLLVSFWESLVIAALLRFSSLSSFSLWLFLDFAFPEDLAAGFCGVLIRGGGVTRGCGWIMGRLIREVSTFGTSSVVPLTTTSVRQSSSVCSLAKFTKTYVRKTHHYFYWIVNPANAVIHLRHVTITGYKLVLRCHEGRASFSFCNRFPRGQWLQPTPFQTLNKVVWTKLLGFTLLLTTWSLHFS